MECMPSRTRAPLCPIALLPSQGGLHGLKSVFAIRAIRAIRGPGCLVITMRESLTDGSSQLDPYGLRIDPRRNRPEFRSR